MRLQSSLGLTAAAPKLVPSHPSQMPGHTMTNYYILPVEHKSHKFKMPRPGAPPANKQPLPCRLAGQDNASMRQMTHRSNGFGKRLKQLCMKAHHLQARLLLQTPCSSSSSSMCLVSPILQLCKQSLLMSLGQHAPLKLWARC